METFINVHSLGMTLFGGVSKSFAITIAHLSFTHQLPISFNWQQVFIVAAKKKSNVLQPGILNT